MSTLVLEVRTATVQHVEVTEDSLVVDLGALLQERRLTR
jgi:hypothetical protein